MAYTRMRKVVQDAIIIVMLVHICIPLSACSPHHACPPASANITQDVFRLANKSANAQLGLWHRLPCQSYRPEEHPFGIVWYRGRSIDDPARQTLITYQDNDTYRESDRYAFSSNFGLIIKGIDRRDEGSFLCQVLFKNADNRVEKINLQVIDDYFPPRIGDGSLPANLQRGHRHKVPCRAPQTPEAPVDVVYWSVGEGITTDTEIIAARFIKHGGTNLFFNYSADFSVNSDASLTVNSLESFQENRVTLWCHVFQSNGTLRSSSTEGHISEDQNSSTAFRHSTTSTFYLKRGLTQVLPCISWTPGDAMCNVQWFHESSEQPLVSYNLSSDDPELDSLYNLAGSFGLVISSANSSHVGQYTCNLTSADSGTKVGVISVFVECSDPGMPEGGIRQGPSTFIPGAEVVFDCLDGYRMAGFAVTVCQESGEWSLPVPKCIRGQELGYLAVFPVLMLFLVLAVWQFHTMDKHKLTSTRARPRHGNPGTQATEPPELFLNVWVEERLKRYRLKSLNEVFGDSIQGLNCRHIVLEGRSGSGKTSLMHTIKLDMEKKGMVVFLSDAFSVHRTITDLKRNNCKALSNVLILVDNCNSEDAIRNTLDKFISNDLSDCQVVITTIDFTAAEKISRERGLCHVTLNGMSSESAGRYVHARTSRHDLLTYLDEHVMPPDLVCLPGMLNALLELQSKTRNTECRSSVRTLIVMIFKCMFSKLGDSLGNDTYGISDQLTQPQEQFLMNCGQMYLSGLIGGFEYAAAVSQMDFSDTDKNSIGKGIKMGLLKDLNQKDSNEEDSCSLLKADCRVQFVLEVFAEFCASKHIAQNIEEWLVRITGYVSDGKLANMLVFTCSESDKVARTVVNYLIEVVNQKRIGKCYLKDVIQLEKVFEICLEVNYEGGFEERLSDLLCALLPEGRLSFIGLSCHRLRLLAYFVKYLSKSKHAPNLKSIHLLSLEKLTWAEFKECVECSYPTAFENIRSETSYTKQGTVPVAVRKQLKLQEQQVLSFPPNLSESSVLRIHSLGVQELLELQYDKCVSSTSSVDLVRYLPEVQNLESVVLWGPVISSQQMQDLAHSLYRFKFLKELDFRFNREMDDRAFEKIMTELSACKNLNDLRLSLYEVTDQGFSKVKEGMLAEVSVLRQLKTLYLLHVSVVEPFCDFLKEILKYMSNLQCVHVSALVEDEKPGVPDTLVEWIRQQNPNLQELFVDGRNALMSEVVQHAGGVTDPPPTSGLGLEEYADLQMESTL